MSEQDELIELYMAETKQSRRIVAPFVAKGLEPPHRWQTDLHGFNTAQVKIIKGHNGGDAEED